MRNISLSSLWRVCSKHNCGIYALISHYSNMWKQNIKRRIYFIPVLGLIPIAVGSEIDNHKTDIVSGLQLHEITFNARVPLMAWNLALNGQILTRVSTLNKVINIAFKVRNFVLIKKYYNIYIATLGWILRATRMYLGPAWPQLNSGCARIVVLNLFISYITALYVNVPWVEFEIILPDIPIVARHNNRKGVAIVWLNFELSESAINGLEPLDSR